MACCVPGSAALSICHCLSVPSLGLCLSVHPALALILFPAGLLPETESTDERIVVPQRGRSTRVPVSSVLI